MHIQQEIYGTSYATCRVRSWPDWHLLWSLGPTRASQDIRESNTYVPKGVLQGVRNKTTGLLSLLLSRTSVLLERHSGDLPMSESPHNPQSTLTARIRTSDLSIRRHPIIPMRRSLFRR